MNCPKCGAPQLKRFHNAFECGSANAGWHYQSNECQRREAFLRLEAERDALQARVKRLEEAGDVLDNHIACGCGVDGPCRSCIKALDGWKQAKEFKP